VGSNLVDALLGVGHEVVCVDNESSESNGRYHWNGGAENHKVDVCDLDSMKRLAAGVDFVFHLAAASRIGLSMEDPVKAFRTNSLGTAVALECARINGAKRFVYSSTSSAYGGNPVPYREHQRPDPLNPYSASKVAGEIACEMYWKTFGLRTLTLRYFNVYGPREPQKGQYASVIGIFRRQLEAGQPLTVVGDGLQRRDFTHVYDVARANILAAESDIDDECFGSVFNIGSGRNLSVLEVASRMSDRTAYLPPRKGEARETLADNLKALKSFGWRPSFRVEDYIDSVVD
jgi:UDP-glucose 4-epimerase